MYMKITSAVWPSFAPILALVVALVGLAVPAAAEEGDSPQAAAETATPAAELPRGVIRLDETVISGNQELPKVLYILPWREPQGLPEIEIQAEFTERDVFRRLYPPAYRRELGYFETLAGIRENTGPNQEE
jgi:hypothetical protein